ncbi:uncharacterized protein METZ01_LOCUS96133 [marine metagenome]|uniref:Uncharacterized protein n=1 Tax=marine metagenome TaxID=408172 RepID=A0A381VSL7_9ZZZZ
MTENKKTGMIFAMKFTLTELQRTE